MNSVMALWGVAETVPQNPTEYTVSVISTEGRAVGNIVWVPSSGPSLTHCGPEWFTQALLGVHRLERGLLSLEGSAAQM